MIEGRGRGCIISPSQVGAILVPGPSLLYLGCLLLSTSFFFIASSLVADMQLLRMAARGVSKIKPAFRLTQFTLLATYRTVRTITSFPSPLSPLHTAHHTLTCS
jgi:hypothetical protein